jgi:hypothetical protein
MSRRKTPRKLRFAKPASVVDVGWAFANDSNADGHHVVILPLRTEVEPDRSLILDMSPTTARMLAAHLIKSADKAEANNATDAESGVIVAPYSPPAISPVQY